MVSNRQITVSLECSQNILKSKKDQQQHEVQHQENAEEIAGNNESQINNGVLMGPSAKQK